MPQPRVRGAPDVVRGQLLLSPPLGGECGAGASGAADEGTADDVAGHDERWQGEVYDDNTLLELQRDLCYTMHEANRPFLVEGQWAAPDEERFPGHLFMADHPIMVAVRRALNARHLAVDQCWSYGWEEAAVVGGEAVVRGPQKPTGLLISASLVPFCSGLRANRCSALPRHHHAGPAAGQARAREAAAAAVEAYSAPLY